MRKRAAESKDEEWWIHFGFETSWLSPAPGDFESEFEREIGEGFGRVRLYDGETIMRSPKLAWVEDFCECIQVDLKKTSEENAGLGVGTSDADGEPSQSPITSPSLMCVLTLKSRANSIQFVLNETTTKRWIKHGSANFDIALRSSREHHERMEKYIEDKSAYHATYSWIVDKTSRQFLLKAFIKIRTFECY